jgi:hypothetical protein
MILLLLAACGQPQPLPQPPAEVRATVAARRVDAGEPVLLTIQVFAADGYTVRPGIPAAEGLSAVDWEQSQPVQDGTRTRTVYHYSLAGEPGSYVVLPGTATVVAPDNTESEIELSPIFVDLGVDGPSGGDLADLLPVPPPEGLPWAWIGGGAAAVAVGAAALGLIVWGRRRPEPVIPPDPAHVLARRKWDAARAEGLADHPLALRLSLVFRQYLTAISDWPATARTSREILVFIESRRMLGVADRLRTQRILEATDRLKYAREGGGVGFFEGLDGDFAAVLLATRPLGSAGDGVSDA